MRYVHSYIEVFSQPFKYESSILTKSYIFRLDSFLVNIWRGNRSVYNSHDNLKTAEGQFYGVNAFIITMRLILLTDINYTIAQLKVCYAQLEPFLIILKELVILV